MVIEQLDDIDFDHIYVGVRQGDAAFARVFRELGIDVDRLSEDEAGARIRPRRTGKRLSHLMFQHSQQIHAVLLALVAMCGELRITPWCGINEPAPAGGVAIECYRLAQGNIWRCAGEIGDLNLDVAKSGGVDARGLPAMDRFWKQSNDLHAR